MLERLVVEGRVECRCQQIIVAVQDECWRGIAIYQQVYRVVINLFRCAPLTQQLLKGAPLWLIGPDMSADNGVVEHGEVRLLVASKHH